MRNRCWDWTVWRRYRETANSILLITMPLQ